jgi:hypothetical protein
MATAKADDNEEQCFSVLFSQNAKVTCSRSGARCENLKE